MPFGWCSAGRLRPMRMVPMEHNYPRYEIRRMQGPIIQAMKLDTRAILRVEDNRDMRHRYPAAKDGAEWNRRPKRATR